MNDERVILHVDLNSFFATAEQQANPYFRNKPIGIIKAIGRSCVIAASIEAKKYGVKTGSDVFEVKKLCPSIILVPADFAKYEDITYRFIKICKTYSPMCEVFSLDECFIDLTETEKFFGGAVNIALSIKDRLRSEIGDYMSCSVGISYNRLLAKLASSKIKADGLFVIDKAIALDILDDTNLMDVCGLGWGLFNHLAALGLSSFAKIRAKSLEFLRGKFGSFWSVHLYNISRGIDHSPVIPYSQIADAKSVGRTYTAYRDLYRKDEIRRLIRNLCEETSAKARQMGLAGRYVGISLGGGPARNASPARKDSVSGGQGDVGGGESFFGHLTLRNYISDGKILFDLCLKISKNWPFFAKAHRGKYVRFCGVTLGMLTKTNYLPIPLFPAERRRQELTSTIDLINQRFGDYTIYPGQLLGMPIVRPEVNGYFGDKSYRLHSADFGRELTL